MMPGHPREEYLLYVRVPDPEDQSLEATTRFLDRLAHLLSDRDAHIYVEPYMTFDETEKDRGTHGRELGIKDDGPEHFAENTPDSTDKNSLRPMYFCHNKF